MNLAELKEENLLEVLGLANQYGFIELQTAVSDYLKVTLNIQNVCLIFDMANIYSLTSLCETCCEFMDSNASEILKSDSFLALSPNALEELLSRDSFFAPEIDIFRFAALWAEQNSISPNRMAQIITNSIRLTLISLDDLLSNVRYHEFVTADVILDAIAIKNQLKDPQLPYRGYLLARENMASERYGAKVKHGEMKSALLDGDTCNYDLDHGFSRHPIDENKGQGIVIELGRQSIINNIKMLLWDRDMRAYSYFIEVSVDSKDWIEIIDHRKYLCRSWQNLRFTKRVVKYIRIVGTHNTVNRVFHLVSFECYYNPDPVNLVDGLIEPTINVATIKQSAFVVEGVSRSKNALINGETSNYDWDSGYTCHQLGSGYIVIELAQPYVISTMRLLLWDCDARTYSYYIEVSNDDKTWFRVTDKTQEACRSWQVIHFEKQAVTFVKIVGTHNTANEVFHCVHFECPADEKAIIEQSKVSKPTPLTITPLHPPISHRLQGLAQIPEEGVVDHGDGYGVGFLGGGGGLPHHS